MVGHSLDDLSFPFDRRIINIDMNIASFDRPRGEEAATVSLTEAQNESLSKVPSQTELRWRRIDPSLNTAVSPPLQKPLVPFHRTEKAKEFKSAIYYAECVLRGITSNGDDQASKQIDS